MANTRMVSMRSNKAHNMRILSITTGIETFKQIIMSKTIITADITDIDER